MLDTATKRRIDTARDILVGKVPDPKSQVEQITIALIYKFMDDMDAESEELGGKRKFFTGDYARYGWARLMAPSLGGHEMLGLYGEGIARMPENPGVPVLFRDIFKNAYNLSGERYREGAASNHSFPLIFLGEESLFRVESGGTPKSDVEEYWGGGIPWATLVDLPATDFISQITKTKRTITEKGLRESSAKMIPANSVVVSTRATIGRIAINRVPIATNQGFKNVVIEDLTRAVPEFVALALTKLVPTMEAWATGGTFAEISKSKFCELQMPLPPLALQKEIVAEIEGYQTVTPTATSSTAQRRRSTSKSPRYYGW